MVVRCFQCNGLLRIDENSLPSDRRAKVRCPHCKGIGLMPDRPAADPSSEDPSAREASDYPALLPTEESVRPPDWKEAAIPHDAFNSFRYPGERDGRLAEKKTAAKRFPLILWVVVSVAIVALFALLVNIILPGPAGVSPAIHSVPPEQASPSGVTEENLDARRNSARPGLQDRR